MTMAFVARDCGTSAVRRRRERRLRSMLRHERMTVAMALAEVTHHSAPRRPTMARARGEESEMNNAFGQKTPPPRAASTMYCRMDDDGDVLAAWPTPPAEVRPLPGVQRHTAAHIEDIVPCVQILDVPVPQLEDRVVDLLREIDAPALVEQVIAVPKISLDRVPQRSVCRRSRRAEQLVEVPTIVSYFSLQQHTIICIVKHSWRARR